MVFLKLIVGNPLCLAHRWRIAVALVGMMLLTLTQTGGVSGSHGTLGLSAYVAHDNGKNVVVINIDPNSPDFHTITNTIPVGERLLRVVMSPSGQHLYALASQANTVFVIDTSNKSVIDSIAVGFVPTVIAITPDGSRAYVPNLGSRSISVIDTDTNSADFNTVIDTVPVDASLLLSFIAITPDGQQAYLTDGPSGTLVVMDTSTNTLIDTDPSTPAVVDPITVGSAPSAIIFTPDGDRAYVSNSSDDTLSVIDTDPASPTLYSVIDTIGVGTPENTNVPNQMAMTSDGKRLYVALFGEGNPADPAADAVAVVDTDPNSPSFHTQVTTIPVGDGPADLALTPDDKRLYVVNSDPSKDDTPNIDDSTSVIDTDPASPAYHTVIDTIAVSQRPQGIAMDIPTPVVCGDQNNDGSVNVLDAVIDMQIITGLITPTPTQLVLSDVVRNGAIDIFDVILTLQHIVGSAEIDDCGPLPG